ncbi:MAG: hypothetical protein ABIN01_00700 [Ferruginibacter sp.]
MILIRIELLPMGGFSNRQNSCDCFGKHVSDEDPDIRPWCTQLRA